ncbi:MAG: ATP-binding protein [Anaerolineaceae bacterium]|nr:MAG: ATP-binding protein [Anaerolineaceae bacterium]
MTGKKETRRVATPKVKVGRARSPSSEDRNTIGRVSRGGIAIQGDYNEVQIQQITQVFQTAPPSVEEEEELARLKKFVPQALVNLKSALREKKPIGGNPYHLLEALDISEENHLAGRSDTIRSLTHQLERNCFAILVGENGMGKTSLLRAGLVPALLRDGHWPVWVEAGGEPLDTTIKKRVLGSLNDFPALARRPLKDVLRLSAAFLPVEGQIVLLLDNVEDFFQQSASAQQTFADLWRECIHEPGLRVRWLFSTVDVKHYFNRFQSGEINPFANLVALSPLERDAAKEAILAPARSADIHVDDALLSALLDDLGNEIDPTRLQIVCHTLAGETASLRTRLDLLTYESLGRADGIMQNHLNHKILELDAKDRDPAWQILSLLESADRPLDAELITKQLTAYGYRNFQSDLLLKTMRLKLLIKFGADGYRLASNSLRPRIREWRDHESVPRQIEKETVRQWGQIRDSAVRGLISGAVGFALLRWIFGIPNQRLDYIIFNTLLYATIGGLIGLLLIFSIDIAIATSKARPGLRYIIGGLGGALTFGLGLATFVYWVIPSETQIFNSMLGGLQGILWGLVTGLGIAWGMSSPRPAWLVILLIAFAGGIVLMLSDLLFNVFSLTDPLQDMLGGLIFPLFIGLGARLGRPAGAVK